MPPPVRPAPPAHTVIGWCELVDLPEWGITGLRAKTDTGARSSSLHVENLKIKGKTATFDVVLHRKRPERRLAVSARIVRQARVRVANGQATLRVFVRTRVRIGPHERDIEINLMDRGRMIHRMLLGRTAVAGLWVDVNKRYALGAKRKKKRTTARSG